MGWCFAIINNKLAELYFEQGKRGSKVLGHCYVRKEEYKTKKEQKYYSKAAFDAEEYLESLK